MGDFTDAEIRILKKLASSFIDVSETIDDHCPKSMNDPQSNLRDYLLWLEANPLQSHYYPSP